MDDLIKLVSQKTGIPQEKAKIAVETVLGYLKKNLPAPIASQIDQILSGASLPNDLVKGLGSMLGKK